MEQKNLEILRAFNQYTSSGGNVLSFPDYYSTSHHQIGLLYDRQIILLALCEELAIIKDYHRLFLILNTVFSMERWNLRKFKKFMDCIRKSELLSPFYGSIFSLHENCYNYIKSV